MYKWIFKTYFGFIVANVLGFGSKYTVNNHIMKYNNISGLQNSHFPWYIIYEFQTLYEGALHY